MTTAASASAFSLAAACIYVVVSLAAALAGWRAIRQRQATWHGRVWIVIAVLFIALALIRCFAIEEWLRSDLREILFDRAAYDERREIQKPLVAGFLLVTATLSALTFYGVTTRVSGRRNMVSAVALACSGAMLCLLAIRLISLHSVDTLLYGPLKLNWIIDLGLSGAVFSLALWYRAPIKGKSR